MTTETAAPAKATVNAYKLRQLLAKVEPHVNHGDYYPGIAGLRLEGDGQQLHAIATDRYTMAIARTRTSGAGDWAVTIPAARLKSLRHWVKGHDRDTLIDITPSARSIAFTSPTAELSMAGEDGDFPKWRAMVAKLLAKDPQPVPLTAVTSEYLSRWGAASTWLSVTQAGPNEPFIFFGDDFIGLQMPARREDGATREKAIAQWSTTLGAAPAETVESPMLDKPSSAVPAATRELLRQVLISANDLFEDDDAHPSAIGAHARAGVHAWMAHRLLQALQVTDSRLAEQVLRSLDDELEAGDFSETAWEEADALGHDPKAWIDDYAAARARRAEKVAAEREAAAQLTASD
ncbi:hypothetical protein ABH930_000278 [Kitasatospora sp. GAS204A]|uniref:DNA polymerase III subunit beta family protein n=1 Tax=unclassified Kitasatospora TaxID=2633591 RepID=UPI0024732750|nr:hypothetical protein [Kitasatospora sp. GAS204B]MDH6116859.1 hypothetical protein [Kitasatospora sp. GAS204B]